MIPGFAAKIGLAMSDASGIELATAPPMAAAGARVIVGGLVLRMMQPLSKCGQPEEIAESVASLCSGASSIVSGHALIVDGCMTIS